MARTEKLRRRHQAADDLGAELARLHLRTERELFALQDHEARRGGTPAPVAERFPALEQGRA